MLTNYYVSLNKLFWLRGILRSLLILSAPPPTPLSLGVCLCVFVYGCVCHVSSVFFPITIHTYLGILKHLIFPIGNTFDILTYLIYFLLVYILLYISYSCSRPESNPSRPSFESFLFFILTVILNVFFILSFYWKWNFFLINYIRTQGSPPASPPIIFYPLDLLSFCLSLDTYRLQRDNKEIWQNKKKQIMQKLSFWWWRRQPKRR